jgi:acetyl esterase/lipase
MKFKSFFLFKSYKLAPESPYPASINDCLAVTKYALENATEFNADPERVVLIGDSAGGNAVAVVTQRLLRDKLRQPKLQVHIYSWLQSVTAKLPSSIRYLHTGITGISNVKHGKFVSWYLGLTNVTKKIEDIFDNDQLISFIENEEIRQKILSYLDTDKIPEEYKIGKPYYETAGGIKMPKKLVKSSILRRDKPIAELYSKVFHPAVSPLLASDEQLKGLPKAYIIAVEWDNFKDEGLLYAQRLRAVGVEVKVAFYENAFHGIVNLVVKEFFPVAVKIQSDLIEYLKSNL